MYVLHAVCSQSTGLLSVLRVKKRGPASTLPCSSRTISVLISDCLSAKIIKIQCWSDLCTLPQFTFFWLCQALYCHLSLICVHVIFTYHSQYMRHSFSTSYQASMVERGLLIQAYFAAPGSWRTPRWVISQYELWFRRSDWHTLQTLSHLTCLSVLFPRTWFCFGVFFTPYLNWGFNDRWCHMLWRW